MNVVFRSSPVTDPYTFESVGSGWEQDRVTRPSGYPFYHYLQTEQGSGKIETAAGTYTLKKDEGLLIAPFIRHSYDRSETVWRVKFATFTGTAERSIPQIMGSRPVIPVSAGQGALIARLIDDSLELYSRRPLDQKQLSVNCYAVLVNIADTAHAGSPADEPLYQNYVLPVIKEIERDYSLPLTIADLSRKVFITPQYLTRLFRRYLNCSAYEYLTSYRLSKAKELLISSPRLEIQDIARRTGFTDSSHFIAVFKKAVGTTPLDFRRMN